MVQLPFNLLNQPPFIISKSQIISLLLVVFIINYYLICLTFSFYMILSRHTCLLSLYIFAVKRLHSLLFLCRFLEQFCTKRPLKLIQKQFIDQELECKFAKNERVWFFSFFSFFSICSFCSSKLASALVMRIMCFFCIIAL